jgi:hypothetical protein
MTIKGASQYIRLKAENSLAQDVSESSVSLSTLARMDRSSVRFFNS